MGGGRCIAGPTSTRGLANFLSEPWIDVVSLLPPDQELFSGMYIDFMGTDAAIFRSLTRRNAVRTDQHNSKWLSGELTFPDIGPPPFIARCLSLLLSLAQSRSSSTPT